MRRNIARQSFANSSSNFLLPS